MSIKNPLPLLWLAPLLPGLWFYPVETLLILLAANAVLLLTIGTTRIAAARRRRPEIPGYSSSGEPFISIQVPCYNEPPELLRATLLSLANLNYEHYEVIVLDNNTPDPTVYEPVRRYCDLLGDKFRFFHYDNVKGFKAGALNIAHGLTDPRAEFILVIDADYVLDADLIQRALPHLARPNIGLIQFPQAYLNTNEENLGMQAEYEHFFGVYMNQANRCNCVLATGTVSFIRKNALEAAGLWRGASITEDVDLGLNIKEAGYEAVYVPAPLGRGLMPTDLNSMSVQRERWVYGNMQTLLRFLKTAGRYPLTSIRTIMLFLTAWFNFLAVPVAVLALCLVALPMGWLGAEGDLVAQVALGSITLELILSAVFFVVIRNRGFTSFTKRFAAFLTHTGLSFEGAVNWIKVPFRPGMPFKRTNKFLKAGMQKLGLCKTYAFAAITAASAAICFPGEMPEFSIALFVAALFVLCGVYLTRQLRATERFSERFYQTSDQASQQVDRPTTDLPNHQTTF